MSRVHPTVIGDLMVYINHYLLVYIKHGQIVDPTPSISGEAAEKNGIAHRWNDTRRLTPLHRAFQGQFSYDDLRIVLACHAELKRRDLGH